MTPAAFLRKFAGREITAGDVATHLGVDEAEAGRAVRRWVRNGAVTSEWVNISGVKTGFYRVASNPPSGVSAPPAVPGHHTPGRAAASKGKGPVDDLPAASRPPLRQHPGRGLFTGRLDD